jgi:hypothetical protein
MIPQRALGLGPTTFYASRERCRLPESLLLVDAMRRLAGTAGSVSLRAGGRFLLSSAEAAAGNRTEDDVVEIADYDPVRHTVLAIGVKEPSADVAVHWLAYRTDASVGAAAFVRDFPRRKGVSYVEGRHPWGSFDEAMAILSLAKASAGPAGIEGRGYLVRGRSVDELVAALNGLALLNKEEPPRKSPRNGRPRRPARKSAPGRGRRAPKKKTARHPRKVRR